MYGTRVKTIDNLSFICIQKLENVLKHFKASYYGLSNYESMHNCRYYPPKSKEKIVCKYLKRIKQDKEDENTTIEAEISQKKKMNLLHTSGRKYQTISYLFLIEAHRCKNKKTLNSVLLYSAASIDTMKILMLSATIADKPEKFAIAGYTLKLYPNIRNAMNWINSMDQGYDHL